MSKYRKSIGDKQSQRLFSATSRVHPRNMRPVSARGGERL